MVSLFFKKKRCNSLTRDFKTLKRSSKQKILSNYCTKLTLAFIQRTKSSNISVDAEVNPDDPENVEEIGNFALKQEEMEFMDTEVKVEIVEDMEEAVAEELEPDDIEIKLEPIEEVVPEEKQAREKSLRAKKYQRAKMAGMKDDHCYSKFGTSTPNPNVIQENGPDGN
jgi:hypothetical protein